jgi:hypothetical protein
MPCIAHRCLLCAMMSVSVLPTQCLLLLNSVPRGVRPASSACVLCSRACTQNVAVPLDICGGHSLHSHVTVMQDRAVMSSDPEDRVRAVAQAWHALPSVMGHAHVASLHGHLGPTAPSLLPNAPFSSGRALPPSCGSLPSPRSLAVGSGSVAMTVPLWSAHLSQQPPPPLAPAPFGLPDRSAGMPGRWVPSGPPLQNWAAAAQGYQSYASAVQDTHSEALLGNQEPGRWRGAPATALPSGKRRRTVPPGNGVPTVMHTTSPASISGRAGSPQPSQDAVADHDDDDPEDDDPAWGVGGEDDPGWGLGVDEQSCEEAADSSRLEVHPETGKFPWVWAGPEMAWIFGLHDKKALQNAFAEIEIIISPELDFGNTADASGVTRPASLEASWIRLQPYLIQQPEGWQPHPQGNEPAGAALGHNWRAVLYANWISSQGPQGTWPTKKWKPLTLEKRRNFAVRIVYLLCRCIHPQDGGGFTFPFFTEARWRLVAAVRVCGRVR